MRRRLLHFLYTLSCIYNNAANFSINRRYEDSEPEDDGLEGSEDEDEEDEEEDEEQEGISHPPFLYLGDIHLPCTFHPTYRNPVPLN